MLRDRLSVAIARFGLPLVGASRSVLRVAPKVVVTQLRARKLRGLAVAFDDCALNRVLRLRQRHARRQQ